MDKQRRAVGTYRSAGKHDDLVLALWYAPRHVAAWDLVSFG